MEFVRGIFLKNRWYQDAAIEAMLRTTDNSVVVLPTGAGKTRTMRGFVEQCSGEVLVLSHIKEILEQNFSSLVSLGDVGLYSAGLGVKSINRITIAGIQSVYKKPEVFKGVSVVLIDECHMVSEEGMYASFLKAIGARYIGLTATPFRLKQGYIYKEGIFDSVCFEAPIERLQKEGYLCDIRLEGSLDEFDTQDLRTVGGDFNMSDASLKFDRDAVTEKIIESLTRYKERYKHWLVFCIDIKHAENVAASLNKMGVLSEAVHSQSSRDKAILDFKEGKIQALTNVNILTVGFDYPEIDLIIMLRPTKSPTLHIQAIGRGLRVAPDKDHCLVKDFAGNTGRLGTIDSPQLDSLGKVKKGKGGVNPFMKTCPDCEALVHPSVRVCPCGHKFKFRHNLKLQSHKAPKKKWYKVSSIYYTLHRKVGKPDSVKVSYMCGTRVFNEWVLVEHLGYAGFKSRYWVSKRWIGDTPIPDRAEELIRKSNALRKPSMIEVEEGGKYPKILQSKN